MLVAAMLNAQLLIISTAGRSDVVEPIAHVTPTLSLGCQRCS